MIDEFGKRHPLIGIFRQHPGFVSKNVSQILNATVLELNKYSLSKLLRDTNVVITKCGQDIDRYGFIFEPEGDVAVSLQALAYIVSLALSLANKSNTIIDPADPYIIPHKIYDTRDECGLRPVNWRSEFMI